MRKPARKMRKPARKCASQREKCASQRERTKPSPDTHLDSQCGPNLYITNTFRQIKASRRKKPLKNVARAHPLYKPAVKMRKRARTVYSTRAPAGNLDTPLSGPLLRLLCHHAHMLANLSVSREQRTGELPQTSINTPAPDRRCGVLPAEYPGPKVLILY